MGFPDQKRSISAFLILVPFIALFISGYYRSVNRVENQYPELGSKLDSQDILEEHQPDVFDIRKIKKNVLLQKGHKTIIDKTCMVFKGVSQGKVLLDLYMLEMDPDASYPHHFSKESLKNGIWLNNIKYQLVSVKKNALRLKVMDIY